MIARFKVLFLALAFMCAPARSDPTETISGAVLEQAGSAYMVSFTLSRLISSDLEARIRSGLSVRFVYQIRLYAHGDRIASTTLLRQVLFLLWDGEYLLESSDTVATTRLPDVDSVKSALSHFEQFKLTPRVGAPEAGPFEIKVSVVIDPVFEKEKEKMSEWLLGPQGRDDWGSRGLVSIFFQWFMVREEELAGERRLYQGSPEVRGNGAK